MLYILDIIGTLAFAISGAFRAVKYELDILGVLTLAILTGVGGGLIRDTLLGAVPPVALTDQTYLVVCIGGALIVFYLAPLIAKRWDVLMGFDAVGLAVFAAIGAAKATALGAAPITVILMAAITATGGGLVRDLFVREIPGILTHDFYATAALCGGASYLLLHHFGVGEEPRLVGSIAVALVLRVLAMRYKFHLPHVKSLEASPSQLTKEWKEKHMRKWHK